MDADRRSPSCCRLSGRLAPANATRRMCVWRVVHGFLSARMGLPLHACSGATACMAAFGVKPCMLDAWPCLAQRSNCRLRIEVPCMFGHCSCTHIAVEMHVITSSKIHKNSQTCCEHAHQQAGKCPLLHTAICLLQATHSFLWLVSAFPCCQALCLIPLSRATCHLPALSHVQQPTAG